MYCISLNRSLRQRFTQEQKGNQMRTATEKSPTTFSTSGITHNMRNSVLHINLLLIAYLILPND